MIGAQRAHGEMELPLGQRDPAAPPIVIEARALVRRFARGRGLAAVSFRHAGPGCIAVTGANGAGKSTLLKLIAGLLRPSGGSLAVEVHGTPAAPAARRDVVGYAAPDLQFYEELTAGENLAFVAGCRGLPDGGARVAECLGFVGLAERAHDRVAALSSGMRQRLRLAFAILHRPPLLLLDEPGSHLDDSGRALTERLVAEQRGRGLVVIATNDEREGRLADARIALHGGVGHPG